MPDRPIIALDVDGVLNPGSDPASRSRDFLDRSAYRRRRIQADNGFTFEMWLNRNHGAALLDLATTTGSELVWCTTWQEEANTRLRRHVGLPELPVIGFGPELWTEAWKYPATLAYALGRPLVWFDDDFGDHRVQRARFLLDRTDTPTLLKEVNPTIGLTDDDLDTARRFLENIR